MTDKHVTDLTNRQLRVLIKDCESKLEFLEECRLWGLRVPEIETERRLELAKDTLRQRTGRAR